MDYNEKFMHEAIALSISNIDKGGGTFGAVIVTVGDIVAKGAHDVTLLHDPTAHAEVTPIRSACQ